MRYFIVRIFSLMAFVIGLFSCKEEIPSGLVLTQTVSKDTSYIAPVEVPQTKKILIEELTGASCVNCPEGTEILKSLMTQNPGRIVVTALHSGFLTPPPSGAKYDFRSADGDALRSFFNEGDPSKPSATFDRVPATSGGSVGNLFIEKGATGGDWLAMFPTRLSKTTPVNIHLVSAYNPDSDKVFINVKLAFTSDLTDTLALTLYVNENGRVDKQEGKVNGVPSTIEDYEFEHIFRKLITPAGGDLILDSLPIKTKGRVLERYISFKPNVYNPSSNINGIILDSCKLIGIVHKTGKSKEVLHVQEVKLK